jgi:hypothetical protein
MKVMIFVKATEGTEAGAPPDPKALLAMHNYNEALIAAGILKDQILGGLLPTRYAKRVHFSSKDKNLTVIDGPFTETKEVIAGFATKADTLEHLSSFAVVVQRRWSDVTEYHQGSVSARSGHLPLSVLKNLRQLPGLLVVGRALLIIVVLVLVLLFVLTVVAMVTVAMEFPIVRYVNVVVPTILDEVDAPAAGIIFPAVFTPVLRIIPWHVQVEGRLHNGHSLD